MVRRLAAIVMIDAVGYSRMMGRDEAATVSALKAHRQELLDPKAGQYGGRTIKLVGDGALMEFPSVVEAVCFAVEVQCAMRRRNADAAAPDRISYRMGINIGDVIFEDGDIYGDGVNVAARLEALAEPDGICLSRNVFEQVREKLDLTFEPGGEHELKNIARPVSIYRIVFDGKANALTTPVRQADPGPARRLWPAIVMLGAVCGLAAGAAVWWQPWRDGAELVVAEPPAPQRSERRSIAVLPFANMSDDPQQEYFADGLTEDLITDLSKLSTLAVVARTSSFAFKGRTADIREIGEALDARYIIEGSVRKVGDKVRINTQLIDSETGNHLWADRYDGSVNDIFTLQDQALERIVGALSIELSAEERRRLAAGGTENVVAHDLYLRGLFRESSFEREGYREAMQLYEQALAIDPDYALVYTRMANILELSARNGWSDDVQADLRRAVELAQKAIALDPDNPQMHWSLGRSVARLRTPEALERGIQAMQRAIELDPEFADAYAFLSVLYVGAGRAEDGLRSVETAMRINPDHPFWYIFLRGITRYVVEDYEAAIGDFEAARERSPTALFVQWWLAAAYAQVGRIDDAEWQVEEILLAGFDGTIDTIIETQPIQHPAYLEIYREGLRKAGIPE